MLFCKRYITFSKITEKLAEGKKCNFPFWFWGSDLDSDCFSSWSYFLFSRIKQNQTNDCQTHLYIKTPSIYTHGKKVKEHFKPYF